MDVPHRISVTALPDAFQLVTSEAAVVVVDMQNDFGSPGGMFDLAGIDISAIRSVIAPTARVIAAARLRGIPVIYLKMAFKPDLSDAGDIAGPNMIKHRRLRVGETCATPDGGTGRILIRDTWNTDIVPELAPDRRDIVLYKHRYSGFFETELDDILRRLGVSSLVLTGCTTSVCVESTLRDAMFHDYNCLLVEDCTTEPGIAPINHDATLLVVRRQFGWTATSAALVEALQAPVPA